MSLLDSPGALTRPRDRTEAARSLEAVVLKQLLEASGAFKAAGVAGGALRNDLFIDALADAVARAGGLGLAAQIERSLDPAAASPTRPPPAFPGASEPESAAAPAPGVRDLVDGASRITSRFGSRRDPFDGHRARHAGVDVAAAEGSPILAAADGVVTRVGPRGGYGQAVEVEHAGGVRTLYAHTSEVLVREGQAVTAGEPIARVGHSGRATGAHLHFEVRVGGHPVNPQAALKAYARRADTTGGVVP